MKEAEILVAVRAAVCALPGVRVWRNNTGVGQRLTGDGAVTRFGLGVGSADLVGMCRVPYMIGAANTLTVARFFALEVKSARGRTTLEQDAWARCVRELGGFCAVVRSAEDALGAVARCRRGASE